MRFQVGKQYPFIAIQYARGDLTMLNGSGPTFVPWRDTHIKTHVVMLTCKEHHKVPNVWDNGNPPTKDCDGFIFEDEDGTVWHNQYPRASYGQLSDRGNNIVQRAFPNGIPEGFDINNTIVMMESAFFRLGEIYRGIYTFEQEAATDKVDNSNEIGQLKSLAGDIECLLQMAGSDTVVVEPVVYGEDKKVLPGHFRARYSRDEQSNIVEAQ